MQFTFEMLEILTKRPGGWATLDELSREIVTAHGQEAAGRFSELCDVDVLEAGLVVEENNGLRITEAGRSVLQALQALNGPAPKPEVISSETSSDPASEPETVVDMAEGTVEGDHLGNACEADIPSAISINVPAFLNVQGEATIKDSIRPRSRNYILSHSVASSLKRFTRILRGHIEQDPPKIKPGRQGGGIGGVIFTVLVLLAIIICVGTMIAVNQIRSLKSEIMTLERQLAPLKKQADNAEQLEKRNSPEEMNAALKAVATDKSKPTDEGHSPSTTLTLSRDEMRLIREYIKPAPLSGPTAQPINLGDSVTIGTIPLPSPLTDKIPKLLGARFTIHNGSIILLKRDSHQADAVLGPN